MPLSSACLCSRSANDGSDIPSSECPFHRAHHVLHWEDLGVVRSNQEIHKHYVRY